MSKQLMTNQWLEGKAYEDFLRDAFGVPTGTSVDRWGDPARVANTDNFNEDSLNIVKAATVYAMTIYRNHVKKTTDADRSRVAKSISDVMDSSKLADISTCIADFERLFVNKYYKKSDGKITQI